MKKNLTQLHTEQKGFVLLFTIVVTAIIFFIGAGIYSLSFKELMVSSISKESQKSIFAADSAAECALWASTNNALGTSFICMGNTTELGVGGESFTVEFPETKTCARVTISNSSVPSSDPDADPIVSTQVISQGFNKCDGDRPVNYAGLAERVYKISF